MFAIIMQSLMLLPMLMSLVSAVPSLAVPKCSTPARADITYNTALDGSPFPETNVKLCWTNDRLWIWFTALNETSFTFDPAHKTNDPLYEYTVMEAFISAGTSAPQTYLELEISPNNVTYTAMIYNPSKRRAPGTPFDHFFINEPLQDGFVAQTAVQREEHSWDSRVSVPLGLFNVDENKVKGTRWRMNFFRTVMTGNGPEQRFGAWRLSSQKDNFHVTDVFGEIELV